ncbi:MAG TPA: hypothetical protein VEO53_19015, partial [Candidatus Binatia bacterium]|nr:hypothetical protein [Candidatus Binatia bacterium]
MAGPAGPWCAGASWGRQLAVLVLLACLAAVLANLAGNLQSWALHRGEVLITLGGIACWRWG